MGKASEMVVEISDRERYHKIKAIVDKTNKENLRLKTWQNFVGCYRKILSCGR